MAILQSGIDHTRELIVTMVVMYQAPRIGIAIRWYIPEGSL